MEKYIKGDGFIMRKCPSYISGWDKDGRRFEEIEGNRFIEKIDQNGKPIILFEKKGHSGQILLPVEGLEVRDY